MQNVQVQQEASNSSSRLALHVFQAPLPILFPIPRQYATQDTEHLEFHQMIFDYLRCKFDDSWAFLLLQMQDLSFEKF